jgi:hypothetical protein
MKLKDQSIFIHKQLVRFLTEAHLGIPLKDLVNLLEKLIPWECDETVREKILPVYELFLTRVGSRINEQNAPFLYRWMQKFDIPEEYHQENSMETADTEAIRSPNYEAIPNPEGDNRNEEMGVEPNGQLQLQTESLETEVGNATESVESNGHSTHNELQDENLVQVTNSEVLSTSNPDVVESEHPTEDHPPMET